MAKARIDVAFHPKALEEYLASYGWYYERGVHLGAAGEEISQEGEDVPSPYIFFNVT
jgi:hypothetical protein